SPRRYAAHSRSSGRFRPVRKCPPSHSCHCSQAASAWRNTRSAPPPPPAAESMSLSAREASGKVSASEGMFHEWRSVSLASAFLWRLTLMRRGGGVLHKAAAHAFQRVAEAILTHLSPEGGDNGETGISGIGRDGLSDGGASAIGRARRHRL